MVRTIWVVFWTFFVLYGFPQAVLGLCFESIVKRTATSFEVDLSLIHAVILVESNCNRWAKSWAGAQGLMQLIPATAARFGVEDPYDPEENIKGGVAYLRFLLDRYHGDERLVLAAYNAGEDNVDSYGGIPPFRETVNYVPKVLAAKKKIAQNLESSASPMKKCELHVSHLHVQKERCGREACIAVRVTARHECPFSTEGGVTLSFTGESGDFLWHTTGTVYRKGSELMARDGSLMISKHVVVENYSSTWHKGEALIVTVWILSRYAASLSIQYRAALRIQDGVYLGAPGDEIDNYRDQQGWPYHLIFSELSAD